MVYSQCSHLKKKKKKKIRFELIYPETGIALASMEKRRESCRSTLKRSSTCLPPCCHYYIRDNKKWEIFSKDSTIREHGYHGGCSKPENISSHFKRSLLRSSHNIFQKCKKSTILTMNSPEMRTLIFICVTCLTAGSQLWKSVFCDVTKGWYPSPQPLF